jgi:hypothetical protein
MKNNTHIVVISVDEGDARKITEFYQGETYESTAQFRETIKEKVTSLENVDIYPISDFMDLVNDQILDNLSESFIGYISIVKKE